MIALLAVGWGVLAGTAVARRRPARVARLDALIVGERTRRGVPRIALPVASRRTLAVAAPLVVLSAVVFPPLAFLVLGVFALRPVIEKRRAAAALRSSVERDIGDVVTLIGLAVNSGHNLRGALRAAGAHAEGPLAASLRAVTASVDHGVRLADALEALPAQLGEVVRPIVVALVSCDRYGAALGPTLDRLAGDVRVANRQRAEAAARRLPIRLLFPLVTCILPAFGLLTVAPLIAGSLRGLRL